jgi:hypothetical protein
MSSQLSEITERLTYSPIESGRLAMPEFVDVQGARLYFGLKQSHLYRLLAEGKIRGVSICQRGRTRGKRLFSCDSIREFLNSQIDKPGKATKTDGLGPALPDLPGK